jgi:cellulose synthase/poly-beta-1,6-N-acetylglucosamine synthase-like glycosyltransferase
MKKSQTGKHRDLWRPFTIVLPAHNEANYLPATLIKLRETFEALEYSGQIIVVNDDSTDATPEIAKEHEAKVIDVSLRNIGAVRNAGAKACETPWLFFLDADTLLPANTLAGALDLLAKGAAGGGAQVSVPSGTQISILKWILFYMVKIGWQSIGGWAAGCFMFCRTEVFEEFGGFDENYFAIEEFFFTKEVARRGCFALVREPVVTSPRKLTAYSTLELLRFVTLPIIRPRRLFKSRLGLEILYDDDKSR